MSATPRLDMVLKADQLAAALGIKPAEAWAHLVAERERLRELGYVHQKRLADQIGFADQFGNANADSGITARAGHDCTAENAQQLLTDQRIGMVGHRRQQATESALQRFQALLRRGLKFLFRHRRKADLSPEPRP